MAGGTDISFATDDLRNGGRMASDTAAAAGGVAEQIAGVPIDGKAFGALPAATALGTTLTAFRDGHAELSRRVQVVHADLAGRAASAAADGDRMVRDTSAAAGGVPGYAP